MLASPPCSTALAAREGGGSARGPRSRRHLREPRL